MTFEILYCHFVINQCDNFASLKMSATYKKFQLQQAAAIVMIVLEANHPTINSLFPWQNENICMYVCGRL